MSYNRVRVPPNPRYAAEVLVLRSSLGAKRKELNAGRAVCDLLEIKRVHCKVVDFNTDARAGFEDGENEALQKLKALGRLAKEGEGDFALPLVFIDGWRVGDNYDLQDLEDDGVLGRILRREVCVNCYEKKDKCMMNCFACKSKFTQIIVDNKAVSDLLSDYYDRVYTASDLADEDDCSEGDSDLRYRDFEEERRRQKPKPAPFVPKARAKHAPRKSLGKDRLAPFGGKKSMDPAEAPPPLPPIISIVPPVEEKPSPVAEAPPAEAPPAELPAPSAEEPELPRMVLSVADFLDKRPSGLPSLSFRAEDKGEDKEAERARYSEGGPGDSMTFQVNQDGPSSLEMARRMVLESILTRKQVVKPSPTMSLARVGSDIRLEELEELPMLSGHMWKKSPNPYRLRSFQWRFFMIREAQVIWWKYKEEAEKGGPGSAAGDAMCNGYINLQAGPVEVVLDEDNETTFSLKPLGGTWEEGAIGKGDTGKSFTFDTTQSEHSRARWARDIAEHVRRLHGR